MRVCRRRRADKRCLLACLCTLCLIPPFLFLRSSLTSFPQSFHQFPYHPSALPLSYPPLCLHPSHFDILGRHTNCFPRVRGLCISPSQVTVCEDFSPPGSSVSIPKACKQYNTNSCYIPSFMRFDGERLTLPVLSSSCCNTEGKWMSGLALVADQRFLPYGKPNPHHEAEKLIPALLMQQKLKGSLNSTLYWFSTQDELSEWAQGFLQATGMDASIQFVQLPKKNEAPLCFEDAVVFSGPTNLWYIPDMSWNKWIRRQVLKHCSIPSQNASSSLKTAAILDRAGGSRHLVNKDLVANMIEKILGIPVKQYKGGVGSFCDQVKTVVQGDILIVPHGSQNTNLMFARPGTIVIEVFPYLFYTDALRNLTQAAGLEVFAILGKQPRNFWMWLFSPLGWDICYFHFRLCKNYARKQPIIVDLQQLENVLLYISQRQKKVK